MTHSQNPAEEHDPHGEAIATIHGLVSERNRLSDELSATRRELAEAKETIECYEAMKEGVTIRVHDAEAQRDAARERIAELVAELLESFNAADNERLKETDEAHAEAAKWRAEGDMYGWKFHEGMASGIVGASIIYERIRRLLRSKHAAIAAEQAEQPAGEHLPVSE